MNSDLIGVISAGAVLFANQAFNFLKKKLSDEPISAQVEAISRDVHEIRKEVKPNGGKSLADKITAISENLETFKDVAEQRWHITLDNSPVPIFLNNPGGNCIYVNQALANVFGMERHDMLGHGWGRKIDEAEKHFVVWELCREKGIPYNDKYQINNTQGEAVCMVTAQAEPVKDKNGKVLFWYGTVTEYWRRK